MREVRDWEQLFRQRNAHEHWLDEHLMLLEAPAILLGDEINTVHFDWDAAREAGILDDCFKGRFA